MEVPVCVCGRVSWVLNIHQERGSLGSYWSLATTPVFHFPRLTPYSSLVYLFWTFFKKNVLEHSSFFQSWSYFVILFFLFFIEFLHYFKKSLKYSTFKNSKLMLKSLCMYFCCIFFSQLMMKLCNQKPLITEIGQSTGMRCFLFIYMIDTFWNAVSSLIYIFMNRWEHKK